MPRKSAARPTDFEFRILKILWKRGPSTAREVLEELSGRREIGYTTVLKMLQLMEGKGLVTVDRAERSHVYAARAREEATLGRLVDEFVDKAFDGAAGELVVHLVQGGTLGGEELRRIERRIADLRRREEKDRG